MNTRSSESKSIVLRRYPKIIFIYPLLIVSIALAFLQFFWQSYNPIFGAIWMLMFTVNLFVIAFETSSSRLFSIIIIVVILLLIFIYIIAPNIELNVLNISSNLVDFGFTTQFYFVTSVILGLILLFVWIEERFEYWKIEKNEVYYKSGILANLRRYPTSNLEYSKEITDVFEYLALRAGKITLIINSKTAFTLDTVINVNKKIKQLDDLLSQFRVKVVNP